MTATSWTRRTFLRTTALAAAGGAASIGLSRSSMAQQTDRRFLFVVCASGGASIVDSLLPMLTGPAAYTEAQIEQPVGSNLRCPVVLDNSILGVIDLGDGFPISTFLSKHASDTAVITQTVSSVNHGVAARRAVIGNGINGGRSIQEAFTMRWGEGLLVPSAGMAVERYSGDGDDATVPTWARAQTIADPRAFALATHGYQGIAGAPTSATIDKARSIRKRLEDESAFRKSFSRSRLLEDYLDRRDRVAVGLEQQQLISRLLMTTSDPAGNSVAKYGLEPSEDVTLLREKLPNFETNSFEAQAALAYLLTKNGLSSAVTIAPLDSPTFTSPTTALNTPIGFDWSHVEHRAGQNTMWSRIFQITDALIDLLKATEYANGESMWDRSFVFLPTEFGRDKIGSGGSGHHLNNGVVCVSPRLKGNRVYGGVDSDTALTYGFDPRTGEPAPGTVMNEGDVYSLVCHANDIEFSGRRDFPGVLV